MQLILEELIILLLISIVLGGFRMTKKMKALSIAGVIVVLGIGVFVGYRKQLETQSTVKVQELVQRVCNLETITRIEYQASDLITLENKAGTWTNTELGHLSYDQEMMQNWVTKMQTLETKEVLKNVEDQSIYGINEESIIITLYDSANHKQTIKLGDVIESEDSMYIQSESDDLLYVVSYEAAKDLLLRPNNFVECQDILQIPDLKSIKVDYKNKAMNMVKEEVWHLNDYYTIPTLINDEKLADFIKAIEEMQITNYIGTYEDLGAYGLDSPRLTLTLNDEIKVAFGSQSGDNIYISINDSQDVYTMNQAVYKAFTGFEPFDAIDRQVIHLNMDEVEEVTLVNPQGTYVLKWDDMDLEVEGTPVIEEQLDKNTQDKTQQAELNNQNLASEVAKEEQENKETQADKENQEGQLEQVDQVEPTVAHLNDKPLTQLEVEEWFNQIKESLWIEAPLQNPSIEQKEERKAEASITFKLKDDTEIVTEFIPYDINYYILRYNGMIEFAVSKDKVTKLFNEMTNFVKK